MLPVHVFFLIGNTVLLILLAVILLKEHSRTPSAILGAVIALGAAAIGMFNITVEWGWQWLEIPLNLLCAASPVAFWLLAKSLFEDAFRWKWWYLLLFAVSVAFGMVGHYVTFGDYRGMAHWILRSEVAHSGVDLIPVVVLGSALVVLGMYVALKDWRADLVESRRRARMISVSAAAIVILTITAVESFSLGTPRSEQIDTAVSGAFFLLILGICARYLGLGRPRATPTALHLFPSEAPEKVAAQEGAQGGIVVRELERMMKVEKVYREEGLTIQRLADKLGVREYRLRRLINGHLGYRNFNSLLNRYRIEEVARQLVAPESRHLPVLSLALDMGYRSLSPFNKAFKEIKGMTPTEYRDRYEDEP